MTAGGPATTMGAASPSPPPSTVPAVSPPAPRDCPPDPPYAFNPAFLDDDTACPGTATVLRMGGLPPGLRCEVWQAPAAPGVPCSGHPRDAAGVRLGEATAGPNGRIAFPFTVADLPGTEQAIWLIPTDDGRSISPVRWSCAGRGRLSGRLYGEDGRPYLRPLTVTARFSTSQGTLAERAATTRSGDYAFDDVPIPAKARVTVHEDGWLLADATLDADQQARGRDAVLDFGGASPDPTRRDTSLPLWQAPFSLPSPLATATPDPGPRLACAHKYAPYVIRGDVDNELVSRAGDQLTLRVRRLPTDTAFTVWQTDSIAGYKQPCPAGPLEVGGVKLGTARSDDQGRLVQRVRLAGVAQWNPFREVLLWLVWPDGVTTELATRWDVLVPSPVGGRLYDEDGRPYTGSVRVELAIDTGKRLLHRSTTASGGTYRFADVPAPADLELAVFQGDRRLARRLVSRHDLPRPMPLADHSLPVRGAPISLNFGGPSDPTDFRANDFPLVLSEPRPAPAASAATAP